MKIITLFIFSCLLLFSCSSNKNDNIGINNFFDVPWGSSKELAKEIMLKNEGMKFLSSSSNDTILYFKGGAFYGIQTKNYDLMFVENKLFMGSINFLPELNGEVLPTYLELKNILVDKYGEPDIEQESVDPSKNNMDDLKNLRKGIGKMENIWYFTVPNSKWKKGITFSLIGGTDISISYLDSGIYGSYLEKKK